MIPLGYATSPNGAVVYEMGATVTYQDVTELQNPFLYVVWGEGVLPDYYYIIYLDGSGNELMNDELFEGDDTYTITDAASIGYNSQGFAVYQFNGQGYSDPYEFGAIVSADELIENAINSVGVNLIMFIVREV